PHAIIAIIALVTGVNSKFIVLLPLPVLLAFLSIWLLLKSLTKLPKSYKAIFTLMFAANLSMYFFFEFYYLSLAFSLFLLFTYTTFEVSLTASHNAAILYFLLFVALVFSHYTAALLAVMIMFMYKFRSGRLSLALVFAATFVSVELLIYTQTALEIALANAVRTPSSHILFNISEYFRNMLLTIRQPITYAELNPYFDNVISQITGSVNRILIILYFAVSLLVFLKSKNITEFIKDAVTWPILLLFAVGIFEIIMYLYAGFGGVLLRITWVALVIFMANICPFTSNAKLKAKKQKFVKILTLIAIALAISIVITNFMKSFSFSMDYGMDYNGFYQKAALTSSYLILYGCGGSVYTDHFTGAIITYNAIKLDKDRDLRVIIIDKEVLEKATGYYVLPLVKAFRAGWLGYIPSQEFHKSSSEADVYYISGFFRIYD
ncbi:MAG: hypothetical protein QXO76_04655, partial [Thermoproteota archaeon]